MARQAWERWPKNCHRPVFVLGAGASISATSGDEREPMPAIHQIFGRAARYFGDDELGFPWLAYMNSDLWEFADQRFGMDIGRENIRINAEELLTNLEIELQRSGENPRLRSALKVAEDVIARTIAYAERGRASGASDYGRFAGLVTSLQYSSVLTFNWDTLLDQLLAGARHFRVLEKMVNGKPYHAPEAARSQSHGVYIKLHGSTSWWVCSGNAACPDQGRVVLGDPPGSPRSANMRCAGCGESMEVFIVPPLAQKRIFNDRTVRLMWNAAAEALQNADELVVWGYSLPPSDFVASWLLRHASTVSLVTVINPDHKEVAARLSPVVGRDGFGERWQSYPSFADWYAERADSLIAEAAIGP